MSTATSPNLGQTPSSSLSISPQTPFLIPTHPNLATSPSNKNFLRYAAALSKSPIGQQPSVLPQKGFVPTWEPDHDHDHPEHHDSFEFGDYGDLKSKSWTAGVNRRAASISGLPSQPSGIISGLTAGKEGVGGGQGAGVGVNAQVQAQVQSQGFVADKVAKGQGVLRRLSLTGGGFARVS
jgi:hypothetical protein